MHLFSWNYAYTVLVITVLYWILHLRQIWGVLLAVDLQMEQFLVSYYYWLSEPLLTPVAQVPGIRIHVLYCNSAPGAISIRERAGEKQRINDGLNCDDRNLWSR